jgi:uncharacterized protein YcaQ
MAARVKPEAELSAVEARAIILHAQGLSGPTPAKPDRRTITRTHERIGSVQLDTISVLARSHELIMYARLGAVGRAAIEEAYWQGPVGTTFEYWAHCACILPMAYWPYFAFRRSDQADANSLAGLAPKAVAEVKARLADGPITVSDVGGAKKSPGATWWNHSDAKRALDRMWWTGDVACARRESWKRVYDLPERAVPSTLLKVTPTAQECYEFLTGTAVRALGVATRQDIANYHMMRVRDIDRALEALSAVVPVQVEGWDDIAWVAADQLAAARTVPGRTTLLSPFDSLIWERKRMKRLFGVVVLLEAYVPAAKRVNGYFAMPVLSGDRIIGHADPSRSGQTLVFKQATLFDDQDLPALTAALTEAAEWVGATSVAVDKAQPTAIGRKLAKALA